jgi:hypothetical protein
MHAISVDGVAHLRTQYGFRDKIDAHSTECILQNGLNGAEREQIKPDALHRRDNNIDVACGVDLVSGDRTE